MRVKRYVVESMPDALQKIRTDLGKDAVILNTKEIRSGGFWGLFGKKKIEVIAADDSSSDSAKDKERRSSQQPAPRMAQAAVAKVYTKTTLGAVIDEPLPFVPDVLPPEPAATLSREALKPAAAPAPVKSKEDLLLEELRQMKDLMNKLSKGVLPETRIPAIVRLENRLLEQEITPQLATRIVDAAADELAGMGEELSDQSIYAAVSKQLADIVKLEQPDPVMPDTSVIHFVGPTGVGKTTTIAKLAAEHVLKHRRKVGFITSDTYRIAAIEQLKTYATILNIPIEVVFSPRDLKRAFTKLADRDLIFMDTAGRNYRNEMYVSELNALLQTKERHETYLVLSMTTKYKDMRAITANFMNFGIDKVLFTKMDETDTYGAIVNLLDEFGLKLSYFTNGQNVPDDITPADPRQIIDNILGVSEHE